VRARGIREVASLGVARVWEAMASHETLIFLRRSTAAGEGASPRDGTLVLRRLEAADAAAYASAIGSDSTTTFTARLSDATSCYAVELDGRIVHASWVTTECAWTRELRSFVCVGPGDAYVYESFTRDDARGRGVYPFALGEICARLEAAGVSRLWVAVESHNGPSLRAVAKAGFERAFEISYRRRVGRLSMALPDAVKMDTRGTHGAKKAHIWLSGDGAKGR
jgi:RimJ/RimL family protein N-acetyltransferase